MTDFRNNHYVPRWYQERFLPRDGRERKFYYLDMKPDRVKSGGRPHTRAALLRWGPARCFRQRDLYTTRFGNWQSTDIERYFFGRTDTNGRAAVEYVANFNHLSVDREAFRNLIIYMSVQKLRTPKGLKQLGELVRLDNKNQVLREMQQLRQIFCATWSECVWSIVDASQSAVKFIVSDHPVTVYNPGCFPGSPHCRDNRDPDIRLTGTHTLFPLSLDRMLVLTNLSWVRNPYTSPVVPRPNAVWFRSGVFNLMAIQIGRILSTTEVQEINFIIKQRASRYVAAAEEEWLYPERNIPTEFWDRLGGGYLLMPDPRSVTFNTQTVAKYTDGSSEAWDAYGRRPGQPGYRSEEERDNEWQAFSAFQGEYARVFGPKRRGRCFEGDRLTNEEDSADLHAYHLGLEKNKPRDVRTSRGARKRNRP
jgi:hypothetical protein